MAQAGMRNKKAIHLIRREFADRYILLALISFAGSVSITRLFLSLSGYPRIESGELHIAHVLWGGLLMFTAALLPLIFANRWVYSFGALFGGVGIGLFMDEVGKFITVKNDYFFPAAAPIIYVFFLLTVLVFIQIRSMRDANRYAHLHKALDKIHEMLEHPIDRKEREQIVNQIEMLCSGESSGKHLELEKSILKFIQLDETETVDEPKKRRTSFLTIPFTLAWQFIEKHMRTILIIGTIGIGLLNLKNPVLQFFSPVLPSEVVEMLNIHAGRQVSPDEAMELYRFRVISETAVGILMLLGAIVLLSKERFVGCVIGCVSFLLCLMVVDPLLFYFEQFSTIITTSIQFILLVGYLFYLTKLVSKYKKIVTLAQPL